MYGSDEHIDLIRNANSKEEIQRYLNISVKEENEEVKVVSSLVDSFNHPDFETFGNNLYLKGVNIPIPHEVSGALIEAFNKQDVNKFNSLKYFAIKLLANPIEDSRKNLLTFVKYNDITLTNSGNLVLFRNVVSKGKEDKTYTKFISREYIKVKKWKKNPSDWKVYEGNICLHKNKKTNTKPIGTLKDLYNNLGNAACNTFTDDYTRSYEIKVGEVYKIREEDIILNKNGSCGGLLHAASTRFNYSSYGDTRICVLVNPMSIARIDTGCSGKIGVSEMFVAGILEKDEQIPDLLSFDEEFEKASLQQLTQDLQNKSLKSVSISEVNSGLSLIELENITKLLKQRIITVN